jgi:anti-sigma B factor antagonist
MERRRMQVPMSPHPPLRESLRPPGPVRFQLSVERRAGALVFRVVGELDVLTAPRLASLLDGAIRRRTEDMVIDLRETEFVDSAGLHMLLSAHRRLTRAGRRVIVACGDGQVRRVIELARLTETLGIVSEYDD